MSSKTREGGVRYTDYAIGKFLEQARAPSRGSTIRCSFSSQITRRRRRAASKLILSAYHIPGNLLCAGLCRSASDRSSGQPDRYCAEYSGRTASPAIAAVSSVRISSEPEGRPAPSFPTIRRWRWCSGDDDCAAGTRPRRKRASSTATPAERRPASTKRCCSMPSPIISMRRDGETRLRRHDLDSTGRPRRLKRRYRNGLLK